MTSSVTWPFDFRGSTSYQWSIVTMHLSSTIMEIWCLKNKGVTSLTFWGHAMSSVTWPFDSRGSTSYGWSIVTMRLSCTVTEIWRLEDNGVTTLTFWGQMTSSVTWPFDSRGSTSYGWSIVTIHLSGTVTDIWLLAFPGTEVGRRSVLNITLISYTPLRYVRNVARNLCKKNSSKVQNFVLKISYFGYIQWQN